MLALLLPNTNTLSHAARALACAEWLEAAGYETHLGLSSCRIPWASQHHPRCHGLHELWELSGVPYPCLGWFGQPDHIEACFRSQEALIQALQPELIIAIFDFISGATARGIPRLSINGAPILPFYPGVLGFQDEPSEARHLQARIIANFWRYAARSFAPALARRKLSPKNMANEFLLGDLNLIYEIDPVCPLSPLPAQCRFIGPIFWKAWDQFGAIPGWQRDQKRLTLYLNFGTLCKNRRVTMAIIETCRATPARLLVSSGVGGPTEVSDDLFCQPFLRPQAAMELADLAVCTGGVGACYLNLWHAVPSLIVPTQPEQATNGLNLSRAGCGRTLNLNLVFIGHSAQYEQAFDQSQFAETLRQMIADRSANPALEHIRSILRGIDTRQRFLDAVQHLL